MKFQTQKVRCRHFKNWHTHSITLTLKGLMMNKQQKRSSKMKTPEQKLAERRARVKQMIAEGRVMTPEKRVILENKKKQAEKLQSDANKLIAGLQASQIASNRYKDTKVLERVFVPAPEATRHLSPRDKRDSLLVKSGKLIQEILNNS